MEVDRCWITCKQPHGSKMECGEFEENSVCVNSSAYQNKDKKMACAPVETFGIPVSILTQQLFTCMTFKEAKTFIDWSDTIVLIASHLVKI